MIKTFTKATCLFLVLFSFGAYSALGQTSISGKVQDSNTGEALLGVNILVKGKVLGTISGTDGDFSLNVASAPPMTLVFSIVGYSTQEIDITDSNVSGLEINLEEAVLLGQEVVVSASRVEEGIMQSPVSIEKMDILAIREAPTHSFYDALANFKGVDMSAQSLTFKSVNTRGFSANGNTRMVQLIDGIDNQAPGLNFSVGNIVGISELDLESAELIPGAASALYGPNALNGILLMNSKSPFEYQGLSASTKVGVTHADGRDHDAAMYSDFSIRYAKAFNNKFAFKLNASVIKAQDYIGVDFRDRNGPLERQRNDREFNRSSNYGSYDGVNVFGNVVLNLGTTVDGLIAAGNAPGATPEQAALGAQLAATRSLIPNETISTRGFTESEMLDNTTESRKFNAAFHYRINDDLEAFVQGNYGSGSTVYTANDRFVLDNFSIWTAKAELKGSNFYVRAYTTQENSGDTYAANTLASLINVQSGYINDYLGAFVGARTGSPALGLNNVGVDIPTAHSIARGVANAGQPLPGSSEFNTLFNQIRDVPISQGGAKFLDKSNMFHYEGMYNFSNKIDAIDLIVGGNYRVYNLNSEGTLFALDDNGSEISYTEFGGYVQASKALAEDKLRIQASLRFDKNENFPGVVSPRLSAVFSPNLNHNFRASFQRGFRNPTAQDQFIDLDVVVRRLIGSNDLLRNRYNFETNTVYTRQSVDAARESFATSGNAATASQLLDPVEFKEFETEKISTYEVGYKGLLFDKLFVDGYYYYSSYTDFIAEILFVQATPTAGAPTNGTSTNALIPNSGPADPTGIVDGSVATQEYGFDINANGNVTAQGWALGLNYSLGGGYNLGGNVSFNELISQQDLLDQGFRASYNTPEWKTNLTFGNRNVGNGFGFNVSYKWQDAFLWESAFGRGVIPSFQTVDAQISYKLPSIKTVLKVGGSNIFNERYTTSFGNPSLGSLYYISLTFDEFLN